MEAPKIALAALAMALVAALAPRLHAGEPAAAAPYQLAIGDRVSVMTFGRADLTGEFTVGMDAAIRVPLLGSIPAAGRSRADIEAAITERLTKLLGYETTVIVDIAAYRPIFVIGDVTTPGEVAYVPGMTAFQAYAKAGGMPSLRQLPSQVASQMASTQRDIMIAQTELNSLLLRRAALEAALNDHPEIVMPDELKPVAATRAVSEALATEKAALAARRGDLAARKALSERERAQLGEEVAALERLIATLKVQSDVVNEELTRIGRLAEKGLATSQRMLELKRSKASTDSSRHEAVAYLSRARQEIIQLDLQLHDLRARQRREDIDNLRLVDGEIARARARIEGSARQMVALSQVDLAEAGLEKTGIAVSISRSEADRSHTFAAAAGTPLRPGDIVQISAEVKSAETGQARRQALLSPSAAD